MTQSQLPWLGCITMATRRQMVKGEGIQGEAAGSTDHAPLATLSQPPKKKPFNSVPVLSTAQSLLVSFMSSPINMFYWSTSLACGRPGVLALLPQNNNNNKT